MKAKKTSFQLADGRELIYHDEHPSADRQIQDTRDLGRTTVRSEIRYDPVLGEWVVLASHRQGRTHLSPAELCSLCPSTTTHYTLRHAASGRQCVSVAVADRPEGPFRYTRSGPLVCQERLGGSIDPHRFVDRDGDGLELTGAPASLGVVADGDGRLWLAYRAWDSAAVGDEAGGQRSMWLDRLSFESGRPRVAGPTDGPQELP